MEFLVVYDTVTIQIILKLMSNLGCCGGHAGTDGPASYTFCSLARSCHAAQQIHKSKDMQSLLGMATLMGKRSCKT